MNKLILYFHRSFDVVYAGWKLTKKNAFCHKKVLTVYAFLVKLIVEVGSMSF